jgi:predicted RND superfamily exporter protein
MKVGKFSRFATSLPKGVVCLISSIRHFPINAVALARFVMLLGALRICRAAVAFPWVSLALIAILTLGASCGIYRLQVHVDGRALSPSRDATIVRETQLRRGFALGDPIIIYFDTNRPDGIFNTGLLTVVSALSSALEKVPGLPKRAVVSLATEAGSRVFPGSLEFKRLLDPVPDTPEAMQSLRDELGKIEIFDGVLVTSNRSGTCIVVRVPVIEGIEGQPQFDERERTINNIRREVRAVLNTSASTVLSGGDGLRVAIVGAPVAELELGVSVLSDLRLTIPLSIVLIAILTSISLGRLAAVAMILLKAAACLIFTFGLMGWALSPIELTTVMMPIILVSTSVSDEVFLLARFQRNANADVSDKRISNHDLANRTMAQMVEPATITSLMMIVGFSSFMFSEIEPVIQFGLFTSAGLIFCWLWSITATPAMFRILGRNLLTRNGNKDAARSSSMRVIRNSTSIVYRNPRTAALCVLVMTLTATIGTFRMQVQDSWIDAFAKDNTFRSDVERVDAALNGSHVLLLYLNWSSKSGPKASAGRRNGPLIEPATLRTVEAFESELRNLPSVGGVVGPASYLKEANALYLARQSGARVIPGQAHFVSDVIDSIDIAQGVERRRAFFSDDMRSGVVTVWVKNADFLRTAEIMRHVRRMEANLFASSGGWIEFGGDLASSQKMISAVVSTQLYSLAFTVFGIAATIILLTGSLLTAAVALMPSCIALLWLFGFMGYSNIPLGVATSMISAMTLGIGCDYAIYYIDRTRRRCGISSELETGTCWVVGRGRSVALRAARETAPAIITISVAVAFGFGILSFSSNPLNARLGLFVALTLLASATFTLYGVGAYVAWRGRDCDILAKDLEPPIPETPGIPANR